MSLPYFLMTVFYLSLAGLVALDASLNSLGLLPWFNGLKWLRVHLLTLGVLVQAIFGIAPRLAALRSGLARPPMRWDIWLALNSGLVVLLVGIPLTNAGLITLGGSLILLAALLLMAQVARLQSTSGKPFRWLDWSAATPYFLVGLFYLLVGALVGMGMWSPWGQSLRMAIPMEVHVHANLWGFASMVFAGLLLAIVPPVTGHPPAWPRLTPLAFWGMALGAGGLVLGPWLDNNLLAVVGLISHTLATLLLLVELFWPLRRAPRLWSPGLLHLFTSYLWFLIPVVVAPYIVVKATNFPVSEVAGSGGPVLIYGWILQFLFAALPYLLRGELNPSQPARLGGAWGTLAAAHLGALAFWLSIFIPVAQPWLRALAYLLWFGAAAVILLDLWRSLRQAIDRLQVALPASSTHEGASG